MDDREKLRRLVAHWKEHSEEHAKTYREWAGKMKHLGEHGAEKVLKDLAVKSEELEKYFEELARMLL
jgi:hypothetical protein